MSIYCVPFETGVADEDPSLERKEGAVVKDSKMYGLLLQNMAEFIQNKYGDNMWKKVDFCEWHFRERNTFEKEMFLVDF